MPNYTRLMNTPVSEGAKFMQSALSGAESTSTEVPDFANLFMMQGSRGSVSTAFPTFTNPNNVSIMTGQPPNVTGICGNFYWNEQLQKEVMMNTPDLIRCDSIFSKLIDAGTKVTVVTAKDKLRGLLSFQFPANPEGSHIKNKAKDAPASTEPIDSNFAENARCFSVESLHNNPELATQYEALVGRKAPGIYEYDNSIYALDLGYQLMMQDMKTNNGDKPSLFYLSTTDYIQHKYAPGATEVNDFFGEVDRVIGLFDAAGAVVGFTADHGMNDKCGFDGLPRIVYVEEELTKNGFANRCILPITDPYLAHHGALGGYATVYLDDKSKLMDAMAYLRTVTGVYAVVGKQDAAVAWDLPADRIGDFVVVGDQTSTLGRTPAYHDLSQLAGKRLRSHGCMEESVVPMFINRPLKANYELKLNKGKARNYDLFDYLLNGIHE